MACGFSTSWLLICDDDYHTFTLPPNGSDAAISNAQPKSEPVIRAGKVFCRLAVTVATVFVELADSLVAVLIV